MGTGAEEFVRHDQIVPQPVRVRVTERAGAGHPVDAEAEIERRTGTVPQHAGDGHVADGALAPEVIDEGLIGGQLIQVAKQPIRADPEIAALGLRHLEALAGLEGGPPLRFVGRLRRGRRALCGGRRLRGHVQAPDTDYERNARQEWLTAGVLFKHGFPPNAVDAWSSRVSPVR